MSATTKVSEITTLDPSGRERVVQVTHRFVWGPFERNPHDKPANQYRGEDDGHELDAVTITDFN